MRVSGRREENWTWEGGVGCVPSCSAEFLFVGESQRKGDDILAMQTGIQKIESRRCV